MMSSSAPRLRPLNLGDLLDETFALYRQNFALFAGIVAVLTIIETIFSELARRSGSLGLTLLVIPITLAFGALITGALSWAVSQRYLGKETSIGEAYAAVGVATFFQLIGASLLYGLIVAVGFVFLIIPGIIFLVRFAFMPEAIVLEQRGVFDSLGRSWALVSGSFWRVLGYGLVIYIIVFFIELVVGGAIAGVLAAGGGLSFIRPAVSAIVSILVEPFRLTAFVLLYYDLRIRKEGFDLEQMARTMGSDARA
jgi:hypothetical protein